MTTSTAPKPVEPESGRGAEARRQRAAERLGRSGGVCRGLLCTPEEAKAAQAAQKKLQASARKKEILSALDSTEFEINQLDNNLSTGSGTKYEEAKSLLKRLQEELAKSEVQDSAGSPDLYYDVDDAMEAALGEPAEAVGEPLRIGPLKNTERKEELAQAGLDPTRFDAVQYTAETESGQTWTVTVFEGEDATGNLVY